MGLKLLVSSCVNEEGEICRRYGGLGWCQMSGRGDYATEGLEVEGGCQQSELCFDVGKAP